MPEVRGAGSVPVQGQDGGERLTPIVATSGLVIPAAFNRLMPGQAGIHCRGQASDRNGPQAALGRR
ncbi:hypothetical protein LUTEI9C_50248 [Luteimonas sp. 9C]|nr:hypothetical protein LUTEI9C_50248 [Luteimonas sp. 9C]